MARAATTLTTNRCAAATCRTCSSVPVSGRAPTPSSARARSPHHREQAGGAALLSRGGGGRLEVQGAPARDREPAQRHAREPDPRRRHPARAQPATSTSSRRRPRSRPAIAPCRQTALTRQHQLWFLKHRDAAREEDRVGQGVVALVAALESRLAELRRVEAELEAIRQAHYDANDALHAAQGALGEAALEVSRIEERIRYVAEGRERVARQRADLQGQHGSWLAREGEARVEHERAGAAIEAAKAASVTLAERAVSADRDACRGDDGLACGTGGERRTARDRRRHRPADPGGGGGNAWHRRASAPGRSAARPFARRGAGARTDRPGAARRGAPAGRRRRRHLRRARGAAGDLAGTTARSRRSQARCPERCERGGTPPGRALRSTRTP